MKIFLNQIFMRHLADISVKLFSLKNSTKFLRNVFVNVQPDMGALPGGSTLQTLTNGIAGWTLMIALIALLVGAASWAIGAHSQNYHQSSVGKRTVLVSAGAALLIGAAPELINFFFSMGQNIH
jgi:hypothetical protein